MPRSLKRIHWRLEIPPERLATLRDDESFHQILALGRLLNTLRFLQFSFLGIAGNQDPSSLWFRLRQWLDAIRRAVPLRFLKPSPERPAAMRQRITTFLLTAAALFEGLRLLQGMRQNFRERHAWQREIAPILQDRLFDRLFGDSLRPLRDGAVFHFFYDVLGPPLKRLPAENVIFLSSFGRAQGQLVYELSDRLALDIFIGDAATMEQHLDRARVLMTRTRDLLIQVNNAGEALIAEYAYEQGFQLVRGPRPGAA